MAEKQLEAQADFSKMTQDQLKNWLVENAKQQKGVTLQAVEWLRKPENATKENVDKFRNALADAGREIGGASGTFGKSKPGYEEIQGRVKGVQEIKSLLETVGKPDFEKLELSQRVTEEYFMNPYIKSMKECVDRVKNDPEKANEYLDYVDKAFQKIGKSPSATPPNVKEIYKAAVEMAANAKIDLESFEFPSSGKKLSEIVKDCMEQVETKLAYVQEQAYAKGRKEFKTEAENTQTVLGRLRGIGTAGEKPQAEGHFP